MLSNGISGIPDKILRLTSAFSFYITVSSEERRSSLLIVRLPCSLNASKSLHTSLAFDCSLLRLGLRNIALRSCICINNHLHLNFIQLTIANLLYHKKLLSVNNKLLKNIFWLIFYSKTKIIWRVMPSNFFCSKK